MAVQGQVPKACSASAHQDEVPGSRMKSLDDFFDKCLKSSSSELPLQVQGSSGQDVPTIGWRLTSSSSELAASAACKCTWRKFGSSEPAS